MGRWEAATECLVDSLSRGVKRCVNVPYSFNFPGYERKPDPWIEFWLQTRTTQSPTYFFFKFSSWDNWLQNTWEEEEEEPVWRFRGVWRNGWRAWDETAASGTHPPSVLFNVTTVLWLRFTAINCCRSYSQVCAFALEKLFHGRYQ